MLITQMELMQSSKIHNYLTAKYLNGEKMNGKLLTVSDEYIEDKYIAPPDPMDRYIGS